MPMDWFENGANPLNPLTPSPYIATDVRVPAGNDRRNMRTLVSNLLVLSPVFHIPQLISDC